MANLRQPWRYTGKIIHLTVKYTDVTVTKIDRKIAAMCKKQTGLSSIPQITKEIYIQAMFDTRKDYEKFITAICNLDPAVDCVIPRWPA